MLRILIADDHEFIRKGLKQILTEEYPDVYIGEAEDTPTVVSMAFSQPWNLVITDISMPGGGGLEALSRIKQQLPQIPVLVLSIYPEDQFALRVLLAGASGYLNKDAAPETLLKAVKDILTGKKYIARGVKPLPHILLDEQETLVFKWLAKEKTVAEIAELMLLDAYEINTIRQNVLQKMNMQTNRQLVEYSKKNNLS